MAKPTTRQQLIDYCFRKLGAPVLEINVDDDQVDDLVDDAINFLMKDTLMVLKGCTLNMKLLRETLIEGWE